MDREDLFVVRRFLLLLICWPLLTPPGFCICRLEAFSPRPAERPAAAEGQNQATTPKRKCRCCRPVEGASWRESESWGTEPTPSTPSPDEHAPGCPASPHWETARVSLHAADGFDLTASLSDFPVAGRVPPAQAGPITAPLATFDHLAAISLYSCNFRC